MTSIFIAANSSTASISSARTYHERLWANLILYLIPFNSWLNGNPRLAHWLFKLLNAQKLALVLLTTAIADVFSFTCIDDYSLSILEATFHVIIIFGGTSSMARRNRTTRLLIYLSIACIYLQKDAFSIAICQILSPIAQGRLLITTIFLLLVVRVVLNG